MSGRRKISRREFVAGMATTAAAACLPGAAALPAFAQQGRGPQERVEFKAVPFALENVRLLDGPFLEGAKANQKYLLSLPVERLVHNFRVTAKLPSSAEPPGDGNRPRWSCEDILQEDTIFRRARLGMRARATRRSRKKAMQWWRSLRSARRRWATDT